MITVRFCASQGFYTSYEVKGHSELQQAGQDILCAAVSALTQTTILGLNHLGLATTVKRRSGYLKVIIPVPIDKVVQLQAKAVMDTMRLGLEDLQKGYSAFIKLEE